MNINADITQCLMYDVDNIAKKLTYKLTIIWFVNHRKSQLNTHVIYFSVFPLLFFIVYVVNQLTLNETSGIFYAAFLTITQAVKA